MVAQLQRKVSARLVMWLYRDAEIRTGFLSAKIVRESYISHQRRYLVVPEYPVGIVRVVCVCVSLSYASLLHKNSSSADEQFSVRCFVDFLTLLMFMHTFNVLS